ncbi:SDR family NAD(P)-dependent oxidoreductase [Halieaceae bacterium IMCC14734]|uniref:SDR family NAD(P)-dependent oxidoreductase n=1 Tax=Candidatus Litorirhabdus singularis TaxID=2518993 RepID=A0ABT3TFD4_9GAMM|nr:SDR family NAD(P)-dependent oxidoreductase [Candidatus Litorirhabdus singularis]MCX2981026.1 SDR family NAD(P)-dependent oxidoreductase [Candidatus Litorirhabdus singularis]
MKQFDQRVAVITGAASGIGLALANAAAARGMKLVLADVDKAALDRAADALRTDGSQVLAMPTDVSEPEQVQALADAAMAEYGAVHLLCNNAGVGGGGCLWEMDLDYWHWVINVNLWGVVHGIRSFTPLLLEQDEAHIVNTASIAGLMSAPGTGPYTVSKHAVVSLSEMLHGELKAATGNVGVSVLCPSFVNTSIYSSERHRPEDPANPPDAATLAEREAVEALGKAFFDDAGIPPERIAELVFEGIQAKDFYLLSHPQGSREQIEKRMRAILDNGHPGVSGAGDFPIQL